MAKRFEVTLLPYGGTKSNMDPASPMLVVPQDAEGTVFLTHDVVDRVTGLPGYGWQNTYTPGELAKLAGLAAWSGTMAAQDDRTQELFLLDDGTNKIPTCVNKGKFYWAGTQSPCTMTNVDAASPITFTASQPVCMFQYGLYVIICAPSHTPYIWKVGDANLVPMLNAGTLYKFMYGEQFHNILVFAFSDVSGTGNIDIRWTPALPTIPGAQATLLPAANQLYKPDADFGITGLKKFGDRALLLYGLNSIASIDYTPDYTPALGITIQATGVGTSSHWSIVDTGVSHIFYDKFKGFVEYFGGANYQIISSDINDFILGVKHTASQYVYGWMDSYRNKARWAICQNAANPATVGDTILDYNLATKQWSMVRHTKVTCGKRMWHTSPSAGNWSIIGRNDGYLYYEVGATVGGNNFAAYRIEPIMSLPDPTREKRLQEIHVLGTRSSDAVVSVDYRGGQTPEAVNAAAWTNLGTTTQTTTGSNVIYTDKCNKWFQLRYGHAGTEAKTEAFKIGRVILKGYLV